MILPLLILLSPFLLVVLTLRKPKQRNPGPRVISREEIYEVASTARAWRIS